MGNLFRALKHRNFRLYFLGQGTSMVGTWIQRVASDWLIYSLTHSPLWLGVNAFLSQVPGLFSPVAGVYIDRVNRHRLLFITQGMAMVQACLLAVIAYSPNVQVLHVVLLNLCLGVVNAIDTPLRQSFVVEMLEDRSDLPNAIALNSSAVTAARLVGPAVAGVVIATAGETACFLLNAVSYIAVLSSLWMMRLPKLVFARERPNLVGEIKEGLIYAFGSAPIRALIMLLVTSSFFGGSYAAMLPVFAKDILHGGPHTLGFLTSASGFGAMFGAVFLAQRRTVLFLGRIAGIASVILGVSLIGLAVSPYMILSCVFAGGIGLGLISQIASTNTLLQTLVEDSKRGRLMSIYAAALLGTAPFGSFMVGSLAQKWGAQWTVGVCGAICLLWALRFIKRLPMLNEPVRSVYLARGIAGAADAPVVF